MKQSCSRGLSVLLTRISVNHIMRKHSIMERQNMIAEQTKKSLSLCDEQTFCNAFLRCYHNYSENECRNIYKTLKTDAQAGLYGGRGVFSLILQLADSCLRMDGDEVFCRHESMVEWREAVHQIGQTIFICAFLASEDLKKGKERSLFAFSTCAKSDNLRLRNLLSQGMAENHLHLKGSAHSFMISWICLMNHIEKREQEFNGERMKRLFYSASEGDEKLELYQLVCLAAEIRLKLKSVLTNGNSETSNDDEKLESGFQRWMSEAYSMWTDDLQSNIDAQRSLGKHPLDYMVQKINSGDKSPYELFAGEHWFLYKMFQAIFRRDEDVYKKLDYFYIYLLISIRFRNELIQSNPAVGFANFKRYQDRKDIFLKKYPEYDDAMIRMAFHSTLENKALRSMEARITPPKSPGALRRTMQVCKKYTKMVNEKEQRAFFVLHLGKRKDTGHIDRIKACLYGRHYEFRKQQVEPSIESIVSLFQNGSPEAADIYGIDAASQEIGCRPEVFAPYFRYARRNAVKQNNLLVESQLPTLRITYHVGEDFLDVVDGLRAVDEAVSYLELHNGDRLGHAMVLGINAAEWYALKEYKVFLPMQDWLDNCAWLYEKMQEYDLGTHHLRGMLKETYWRVCTELYGREIPLEAYYDAWRLRGDEPEYYMAGKGFDNILHMQLGYLREDYVCSSIRKKNKEAAKTIQDYHYNYNVRKKGREVCEITVEKEFLKTISELQRIMRIKISELGIGIETNPSSNYLIGGFKRYDKHPIFAMNNTGLVGETEAQQMFVSINTDDSGVFDTNLENEFALMACALENMKDENGQRKYSPEQIYRWIDTVRRMGMEQSFKELDLHVRGN